MITIKGIYTSATIFSDNVEEYALAQIQMLCDTEAFQGCRIRVMPDVHPGKVVPIGFTSTVGRRILPFVVGIDVGCGVTMAKFRQKKIEYQKLDKVIRENIPAGSAVRRKPHRFTEDICLSDLRCCRHINQEKALCSLGTLGGGNHFIEIDQDEEGFFYAVVHSGSRRLGKEVTDHYVREGQKYLKSQNQQVPYELTFLEGALAEDYIHDLQIVQRFAARNREAILDEIARGMKWKFTEIRSCAHNYVEVTGEEKILRKGAISARNQEPVIIPINMRDGIILGTGRGQEDWNFSAPHGAGRIMSRGNVGQHFTLSQFKEEMKGVYCSCIRRDTLDEAPFAYRKLAEIADAISDTVTLQNIIRPVYNFKAGGQD